MKVSVYLFSNPNEWIRTSCSVLLLCISTFTYAQPCSLTWYRDYDADGFGDISNFNTTSCTSSNQAGYVLNNQDCNDSSYNVSSWNVSGSATLSSNAITKSILKATSDGSMFLLYRNYHSASDVPLTLKKFDGSSWSTLGNDPISADNMYGPDMTIDKLFTPYISYVDYDAPSSTNNRASVMKYNGTAWEHVGPRRFSDVLADNGSVSIAVSGNNEPYVLMCNSASEASVWKYNAGTGNWDPTGGVFASLSIPEGDLEIDEAGIIYTAFTEATSGKVSVMKYDGISWSYIGNPELSDNDTDVPQLIISHSGEKYVAYLDYGDNEIVVRKFNAGTNQWQKIGSAVSESSSTFSFAVDRFDTPYVAYRDNTEAKLKVKKWDNAWTEVTSNLTEDGLSLSITVSPATNLPSYSYQNLVLGDYASVKTLGYQIVPPSLIALNVSQSTICPGATSTLTADGTLHHAATWNWYSSTCGGTSIGNGSSIVVSPNDTTQYYVRAEGGCQNTPGTCVSNQVNVLDAVAVISLPDTQQVCEGLPFSLSFTSSGTGQTYQWLKNNVAIPGATSNTISLSSVSNTHEGKYKLRITGTCTTTDSEETVLEVNTTTAIQTQPSGTTVCENAAAGLSVTANGSSLSYQWFKNNTLLAGQVMNNIVLNSVSPADTGTYTVEVSGACGTIVSDGALLSMQSNPLITLQPTDQTVCNSGMSLFEVQASGLILGYQWKKNGVAISGATNDQLQFTNVASADSGEYFVVLSGLCGSVNSDTVDLNVNVPDFITSQPPAIVKLCEASAYTLSFTPNSPALDFQWYVNRNDGNGWILLSGETNSSLQLSNVSDSIENFGFRSSLTNTGMGCTINTTISTVNVLEQPVITLEPTNQRTCYGNDVIFIVGASGTELEFQWQQRNENTWLDLTGETSPTLQLNSVSADLNETQYRVRVSNLVCPEIYSDTAVLTVNSTPGQGECLPFIISEAITPNGDGILDEWIIQGIERYPDNEVKIFNIWGDLVFETNGYRNENNCWNGKNHHAGVMDGIFVPDGNYFYQLNLGDGSALLSGFIRLKR